MQKVKSMSRSIRSIVNNCWEGQGSSVCTTRVSRFVRRASPGSALIFLFDGERVDGDMSSFRVGDLGICIHRAHCRYSLRQKPV